MKAVLALVLIYVGAFIVAVQGSSQTSVQAAQQHKSNLSGRQKTVDPAKEADINSLMELMGARAAAQGFANKGIAEYRENLLATVPADERGQGFVNAFVIAYQHQFSPDDVLDELVSIYDKHFTEDEIKGLLQFYGSPVGQKYAAEMPQVTGEISTATHAVALELARNIVEDLRKQYPVVGAQARLSKSNGRPQSEMASRQELITRP